MSILYADDHNQWFPVASTEEPKAFESFQLLVDAMKDARDPEMYICPASNDKAVEGWNEDSGEPFTLTEENVSFAWRCKKLRATGSGGSKTTLGCDNSIADPEKGIEENHEDGINMLYVDGAIKWLGTTELKNMRGYENQDMTEFLAAKQLGI